MANNLFLLIILFCVVIFIINYDLINKRKKVANPTIESFVDNLFTVDKRKVSEEKSVRFSKKQKYNSSRVVYGFDDIEYFNKNKDNIFRYYGIESDKLKKYFDEKYILVKNNQIELDYGLPESENGSNYILPTYNEIGIGSDKEKNVEKIYILVGSDIYSLKKNANNNYVESIYKDDIDIKKKNVEKYLGEKNYEIINNNIEDLKINNYSTFTESLNNIKKFGEMMNMEVNINGMQNLFDRDLRKFYKETPQKVQELQCFTRYDNDVMMGYNFDIYNKKLLVKNSKPFLEKLLTQLGCNIENMDTWIEENKDFVITYISFIKKKDDFFVTVYYNRSL